MDRGFGSGHILVGVGRPPVTRNVTLEGLLRRRDIVRRPQLESEHGGSAR